MDFPAGRTVVRVRLVAPLLGAGWLFGTAFACGRAWLEVCRLLFLDSNVVSEKQTPGIKQNNRLRKTCESIKQDKPKRASLSLAMLRLVTILSWSLLARSYWSPVNKPCYWKLSRLDICVLYLLGWAPLQCLFQARQSLFCTTAPPVPFLLSPQRKGCLLQAVTHQINNATTQIKKGNNI